MTGLIRHTYFLNQQETKYVFIYLNEGLKREVKIGTSSGHVLLNEMQWFILVTFTSNIVNNEVHNVGDPILRTPHIIRKVLQCEASSLSCVDHRWSVTKDVHIIIIIIIIIIRAKVVWER